MLEHQGAFGIDADSLAHRAMSPGAPAYNPIIKLFGQFILTDNGRIDRQRLGRIAFNDPEAMAELEKILHPIVIQVIGLLIKRSTQKLVVIEAIKLFETELAEYCDTIWVVDSPEEVRVKRLISDRKMPADEARRRVSAQSPQAEKLASASVVIRNGGDFESTYKQVMAEFAKLTKEEKPAAETEIAIDSSTIQIIKGGPKQAADMATFLKSVKGSEFTRNDILMKFGQRAYLLAYSGSTIIGLAGWQIENLITRVTEILMLPTAPKERILGEMVESIEKSSLDLQSELSLLFIEEALTGEVEKPLRMLDYERTNPSEFRVPDWRDAVEESAPEGTVLFAKKLREDRILRPM